MILISFILFAVAFLSSISVILLPSLNGKNFKPLLSFSGAYLFSLTFLHILPEIFISNTDNYQKTGLFILIGFFFPLIAEFFSASHSHDNSNQIEHTHENFPILIFFFSLMFHAVFEGALFVEPAALNHHLQHNHHRDSKLMIGLILHKIPEAFAITTVLWTHFHKKILLWICVFAFAIATPLGILLGDFMSNNQFFSGNFFSILFAIVCGNLIYVSAAVFFESTPGKKDKALKLITAFGGVFLAIVLEMIL